MIDAPLCYVPIGVLRTPFSDPVGMPIQPIGALGTPGRIVMRESLTPGLADLEGFSHLIAIYHFHRSSGFDLEVKPFLDDARHGVFATRAPRRPNQVGLSVLKLTGVEGNIVHVENVDMLDGSPVLDVKPYVPRFDVWDGARAGWFEGRAEEAARMRSDGVYAVASAETGDTAVRGEGEK